MFFRTVVDTNVVLAAQKTRTEGSPNAELIQRWRASEFVWLYSGDILTEYVEKLLEHDIAPTLATRLINEIAVLGETVRIGFFHLRHYPVDSDDTPFLLVALNGGATHLVTYDGHLEEAGVFYPEFKTCGPLEFLQDLRRGWGG
ncbi:MAG: putative toxin-antitoxin system toxin component, PIN family [Verrucomicrobiales bacterium]|nr:putative toxin-antitoxin system toxin component, PIN family [Verrucomicrobiales bacterium]